MFSLDDQKVIVIGASSGIGLAIARSVVAVGGQVVLASRSTGELETLAHEMGARATAVTTDITDELSLKSLFANTGHFDHLVITARSSPATAPFAEMDTVIVSDLVATKFMGAFHATRQALPLLRPDGSITFLSGVAAWKPAVGYSVLGAMNGALPAFARGLALEIAPIRVNVISPGIIDTPYWNKLSVEQRHEFFAETARQLPVRRVGQPQDVAQAAIYLMCSSFTTGTTLHVDGGGQLV